MISKVGKKSTPAKSTATNNANMKKPATPKAASGATPKSASNAKAKLVPKKVEATPKKIEKVEKMTPLSSKKSKKDTMTVETPVMKTPGKSAKKLKVAAQKDGLILKHCNDNLPDEFKLKSYVQALFKVHEKVGKGDGEKKQLFDQDGIKMFLQINGIKLPRDDRKQILKARLPHSTVPSPIDVCLIVKDLKKGLKEDHEDSVNHFKDLLEDQGVKQVTEVISLRQLKVEYKQYETKLALTKRFDVFLADDRITRLLPKFLGKPFYARKKFPVPVNLKAKALSAEIDRGMHTVTVPLSHHGTTSRALIGYTTMEQNQVVENLGAMLTLLANRYPGGVKNIRSLHIKTENSPAVPIHVNTASGNDLGFVDADIPKKVTREVVTGELSTRPGMEVTVTPSGNIKVAKTGDPFWDDEKDEPFVSGSEAEEESDAEESQESAKKAEKRKAAEEPKKEGKTKKAKKEKAKKEESDEDSEEEEINQTEIAYMKRVQGEDDEKIGGKKEKTAKAGKKAKKEAKLKKDEEEVETAKASKKTKKEAEQKKKKQAKEESEEESDDVEEEEEENEESGDDNEVEAEEEESDNETESDEGEEEGEGEDDDESEELEFTDGSDSEVDDDDQEDSDEEDSDDDDEEENSEDGRIQEVYDDEQELDEKDVIVDSDSEEDDESDDGGDDKIMLDKDMMHADSSGDDEPTPKKSKKKLPKNERRKQRNQQKQKATAKAKNNPASAKSKPSSKPVLKSPSSSKQQQQKNGKRKGKK